VSAAVEHSTALDALERLRSFGAERKAGAVVQDGTMLARASDALAVYRDTDLWADPAAPRSQTGFGPRIIDPQSVQSFSKWAASSGHIDLAPVMIQEFVRTARGVAEVQVLHELRLTSYVAARVLLTVPKYDKAGLPEVVRRVNELADGGTITPAIARKAFADYRREKQPDRKGRAKTTRIEQQRVKFIAAGRQLISLGAMPELDEAITQLRNESRSGRR
jgi:hypothetical protein